MSDYIIVLDFETGSAIPSRTQPTQLSAIAIDSRTLEFVPGSEFDSYIQPIFDDKKAVELGLDPLQEQALKITRITREILKPAPPLKQVWSNFTQYVKQYAKGNGKFNAPAVAGFNIYNFDLPIVKRICCTKPYGFGPKDKDGEPNLFHFRNSFDVMKIAMLWLGHLRWQSYSMDSLRRYFGIPLEGAHNSLIDVKDTGALLIKFLSLSRDLQPKIKFENSFVGSKHRE